MNTMPAEKFSDVEMFRTCEQCGSCSSGCPITGIRDFNVRRIIRHIELDLVEEIAGTPFPWYCTTCGRCETVCPNGIAILDIIRPLRAMTPPEFVPEVPAPCSSACPAGIDVPGYLRLIAQGKPEEACALILEKVPFPGILGRVCVHPCETECRRGEVNKPISICALKRYAADRSGDVFKRLQPPRELTGHRVAVVGSGPAGLTAAFYCARKGHEVTLFEERPKAGGMMRYGIPRYRLPDDVLDREIDQVLSQGIKLETGKRLGRDFDLDRLRETGFEAVFIAIGLQLSITIGLAGADTHGVPGEKAEGVRQGVDFLRELNLTGTVPIGNRIAIIGGGDVAIDVARSAVRLGAEEVIILYRRTRAEMPAWEEEIIASEDEGVKITYLSAPKEILTRDGRVTGVRCIRMELGEPDSSGRRRPVPVPGSEYDIEIDQLIPAIGQAADLSFAGDKVPLKVEKGLLAADESTHETEIPGVFAGGDVSNGPGAVIDAIAAGRRAASSIDRFLGGDGVIDESLALIPESESYTGTRERGFADLPRREIPTIPFSERHGEFTEVDLCFDEETAVGEACRCLQCDLEWGLAKGNGLLGKK